MIAGMRALGFIVATTIGTAFFGLLAGCVPTIKYGSPPRIDQLESLKVGSSRTEVVRKALGEPRGYGALHHAADPTPWVQKYTKAEGGRIGLKPPVDPTYRRIWFYEYSESSGSRVDIKFLLVFFREDFYDGHFWFSSANLLDVKR